MCCSVLGIQPCHWSSLGHCCGIDLNPGRGTSTCPRLGQKEKKKMVPTFQMVEAEKYLPLIVLSVYSVFLIFEGDVIGSLIFISLILVG